MKFYKTVLITEEEQRELDYLLAQLPILRYYAAAKLAALLDLPELSINP